jgi:hypothetical protein
MAQGCNCFRHDERVIATAGNTIRWHLGDENNAFFVLFHGTGGDKIL